MNRRTIIRTAFGASIAAALGLTTGCGDTYELIKWQLNSKTSPPKEKTDAEKTAEFYAFFKEVNGFPINAEQKDAYHMYIKKYRMYFGIRQCGMSTLQNTIAFHEAYVNKQKVALTAQNVNMIYRHYEITLDQLKLHKELCRKEIADASKDNVVIFPGGGSIAFIATSCNGNIDKLEGTDFDIRLINIDAIKFALSEQYVGLPGIPTIKGQTFLLGTSEHNYPGVYSESNLEKMYAI